MKTVSNSYGQEMPATPQDARERLLLISINIATLAKGLGLADDQAEAVKLSEQIRDLANEANQVSRILGQPVTPNASQVILEVLAKQTASFRTQWITWFWLSDQIRATDPRLTQEEAVQGLHYLVEKGVLKKAHIGGGRAQYRLTNPNYDQVNR